MATTKEEKIAERGASAVAGVIQSAIVDRWLGSDRDLATAAGISVSSLADMKANGVASATKNFKKLCRILGMDVRQALKGRRVYTSEPTTQKRSDLHDMLNRLIGTADEPTIERVMRGLLKAAD